MSSGAQTVRQLIQDLQRLDPDMPVGTIDSFKGIDKGVGVDIARVDAVVPFNWEWPTDKSRYVPAVVNRMIDVAVIS